MLYYRYRTLRRTFFHGLGIEAEASDSTDRDILERGTAMYQDDVNGIILLMPHSLCRLGYCGELLEQILRDLGCQFGFINLSDYEIICVYRG